MVEFKDAEEAKSCMIHLNEMNLKGSVIEV